MTISAEQIIAIAGVISALGMIWAVISKPFKAVDELKKSVDKLTESMVAIKEDMQMNSDMVYQLLNHASTNNNSGGMREALDKYNAYYRH